LAGVLVSKSAIFTVSQFIAFFSIFLPLDIFAIIANNLFKNSFKINATKKITQKSQKTHQKTPKKAQKSSPSL